MSHGIQWPIACRRGMLGKLPEFGDFFRAGAQGEPGRALERWLTDGMHHLERVLEDRWVECYDSELFHRFVMRAEQQEVALVGCVRAAMDALRRRYPVVIYAELPVALYDAHPHLVFLAAEQLFDPLEETLQSVAHFSHPRQLNEVLADPLWLHPPEAENELRYHTFLEDITCGQMSGPEGTPGTELLERLVSSLSSLAGRQFSLSEPIAMPLRMQPFARPLEARFWLELTLILLRWYPAHPSWVHPAAAFNQDPTAAMHLSLRPLQGLLFPAMVQPGGLSPGVWAPWLRRPLSGAFGSQRRRIRLHEEHPLRELLDFLQPGYPNSCPWTRASRGVP